MFKRINENTRFSVRTVSLHLAFILLIWHIPLQAQQTEALTVSDHFTKGKEFLKKSKPQEALFHLEQAYKEESNQNNLLKLGMISEYLGDTYFTLGKYELSSNYFEESINFAKQTENDSVLIERLNKIGETYFRNARFEKSINRLTESKKLIEELYGKNSEQFAENLLKLSYSYRRNDQSDQALVYVSESIGILEELLGPENKGLSQYKSELAYIYSNLGFYDKALSVQNELLRISFPTEEDKNSVGYGSALIFKAFFLEQLKDFDNAIILLKEAKNLIPEEYHYVVNGNIGKVYTDSGIYDKGLEYTLLAKKQTSPEDQRYLTTIQNLAYLYTKLGDYDKAQLNYELAQSIVIQNNRQDEMVYGRLLNNIGKMYRQMGDLKTAEPYFKQALDIFLNTYSEEHIQYGYQLNDYAFTLFDMGQYDEALKLLEHNLELSERNNKQETQEHYNWKFSLAEAYNRLERYDEALPLALEASNKTKYVLGEDHPIYGNMLKGLSRSYIGLNKMDSALPLIKSSNDIFINEIRKVFQFRSEKEKRDYLVVIKQQFDDLQSLYHVANIESTELNSINLNNHMLLKGLLLNNSKGILNELSSLADSSIDEKIRSYRSSKILLEKELGLPLDERELDMDSLKSNINKIEGQLVKLHSSNFSNTLELNQDWTVARDNLKEGELVVDFSSFELIRNGKRTDSTMYAAFIYGQNSRYPERIPIFEEEELKSIIDDQEINDLYTSEKLYDLIWEPLMAKLNGNEIIYFSPSGLLNQLSLQALRKDGEFISNQFNFIQLSNSNVLFKQLTEPGISSTLLIGGINYEYKEPLEETINKEDLAYLDNEALKNSNATRSRGESWTYLPGSLSEIEGLKAIFDSKGFPSETWTGESADEAAFKALSGTSSNILHIATHGFFFENLGRKPRYDMDLNTEDRYRLAEDPLLRSGIILAGANYTWKNGSNPFEEEDGILTAMEISNLDLSNTDMVVLSACETGLGDIDGSEGVYGLQRAFKMAGVDIIVMSLWQVPDSETAEFMNLMYGHWAAEQNVRKAFNHAQRIMQEKYKDEPEKWAAFVMFE